MTNTDHVATELGVQPTPHKEASWCDTALSSVWSAIKSPVTGVEQLTGSLPIDTATQEPSNETARAAGQLTGTAVLYGGATLLGRMTIGRVAAPIVGGALGFLEPTTGGIGSRLEHMAAGVVLNTLGYNSAKVVRNNYLGHADIDYVPGGLTTDWVKVGNQYRQFQVRIPELWDKSVPSSMVVAADSSLVAPELLSAKGYIHGMDDVNGVGTAANDYKTVVMYAIPKSRWGGLFRTWNTRDGVVSMFGTRGHDDSEYLAAAMQKTMQKANIDRAEVFAFGYDHGGTMLQYHVGVAAPGTFKDIAVYSSTVSPKSPMPRAGTGIQVGHSIDDPTLGWNGERGGIASIPEKFGYTNLENSQPFRQAPRFAEANGVTTTPEWQSVHPEYDIRTWMSGDRAIAQEIRFNRRFHGVPGRAIGGNNESFTSSESLQGAPPPVSAVDLAFGQFFKLTKVGAAATIGA